MSYFNEIVQEYAEDCGIPYLTALKAVENIMYRAKRYYYPDAHEMGTVECFEIWVKTLKKRYRRFIDEENTYYEEISKSEAIELMDLFTFFGPMCFKKSVEITRYITTHNFSYRFPNLTGLLTFTSGLKVPNGISPKFYYMICSELGLSNMGTKDYPISFISNKNLRINNDKIKPF